jgi:hypothetical protein
MWCSSNRVAQQVEAFLDRAKGYECKATELEAMLTKANKIISNLEHEEPVIRVQMLVPWSRIVVSPPPSLLNDDGGACLVFVSPTANDRMALDAIAAKFVPGDVQVSAILATAQHVQRPMMLPGGAMPMMAGNPMIMAAPPAE